MPSPDEFMSAGDLLGRLAGLAAGGRADGEVQTFAGLKAAAMRSGVSPTDMLNCRLRRNLLGEGIEHQVFRIPELPDYALRVEKSGGLIPIDYVDVRMTEIEDPLNGAVNVGQSLAEIVSRSHFYGEIVPVVHGDPYGPSLRELAEWDDLPREEYVARWTPHIRQVAEMPQAGYDNLARQLKATSDEGLLFDPINPNNIMVDERRGLLNGIDFSSQNVRRRNSWINNWNDMVETLAAPNTLVEPFPVHPLQSELQAILEKSYGAAKKAGLPAQDTLPLYTVFMDAGLPQSSRESMIRGLNVR